MARGRESAFYHFYEVGHRPVPMLAGSDTG